MCFRKRGDCPFLQAFQMLDGEKTKNSLQSRKSICNEFFMNALKNLVC